MNNSKLSPMQRNEALVEMRNVKLDILVIGGGITGAGIALDAASRGLKVGLVEAQDYASGTSSRSSKLVHGGLRYLYQLDLPLVVESLKERGILLTKVAPHLVHPQPLLWPFTKPVVERAYSTLGVLLYDCIAHFINPKVLPWQRHLSKRSALSTSKCLNPDSLCGAMVYYDCRVDDAQLVISVLRTAVERGALVANRTKVVDLSRSPYGRVTGCLLQDLESGEEFCVSAKIVVNATGVWTQDLEDLITPSDQRQDSSDSTKVKEESNSKNAVEGIGQGSLNHLRRMQVRVSKGIHLLIPKDKIQSKIGLFLRTDRSVLFILPWKENWIIGTTDTPYHGPKEQPLAEIEDIEYLLSQANRVLAHPLEVEDIIGVYSGLRPLVASAQKKALISRRSGAVEKYKQWKDYLKRNQKITADPKEQTSEDTTKISRSYRIEHVCPGFVSIAGGKLTVYRKMAKDLVDTLMGAWAKKNPSQTQDLALVGSQRLDQTARIFLASSDSGPIKKDSSNNGANNVSNEVGLGEEYLKQQEINKEIIEQLYERYGDGISEIMDIITQNPNLSSPLGGGEVALGQSYLQAEVIYAIRYQGALHLDDVISRRLRILEQHRAVTHVEGTNTSDLMVGSISQLMATELRWTKSQLIEEESSLFNNVR